MSPAVQGTGGESPKEGKAQERSTDKGRGNLVCRVGCVTGRKPLKRVRLREAAFKIAGGDALPRGRGDPWRGKR